MTTFDEVLDTLRSRVAQRRQEGKYPPGLEQQLQAEFAAILEVVHRGEDEVDHIGHVLRQVRIEAESLHNRPSFQSRIPGGALVHKLIWRLLGRHIQAASEQTYVAVGRQIDLLELVHEQLRIQRDADLRVLNQLEYAIRDRLMMIDVLAEAIVEIERKITFTHS